MPRKSKTIRIIHQKTTGAKSIPGKKHYTLEEIWQMGQEIIPTPHGLDDPGLSETADYIGKTRYARRNLQSEPIESAKDMFWRVAYNIACAELARDPDSEKMLSQAKKFYHLMSSQKFIPNTPTMLNAGKSMQQLSACFVLPIEDDMRSIAKTLVDMVMIHKSGGGTGFSFSRLRPHGDIIHSSGGTTVGPTSFLQAYNDVTSQVKQGGVRRGANMGIMHITHPDVLRFAVMKVDEFNLTNFNISVTVTEKWMEQVKKDARFVDKQPEWNDIIEEIKTAQAVRDVDLKLKRTEDGVRKLYDSVRATQDGEGYELINPRNGQVTDKLNANKVFLLITQLAWQYGDPGMIMIDRINNSAANPTPHLGQIEATNPCVTADTWVHTSNGPRQVQELIGNSFSARINGRHQFSTEDGFVKTGHKPVLRIITGEGYQLRVTADHLVRQVTRLDRYHLDSEWQGAGKLQKGDQLLLHNHRSNTFWKGNYNWEEGYLIGLLIGDGTLKSDKAVISVWSYPSWENQVLVLPSNEGIMRKAYQAAQTLPHRRDFVGFIPVGASEYRLSLARIKQLAHELGMRPGHKTITSQIEKASSSFYRGLLRGLFDSDGSVQGSQKKGVSVRLSQSDLSLLEAAQRMLLRLGVACGIYQNRRMAGTSWLPDSKGGKKEYAVRSQHELVISGDNLMVFSEEIGFSADQKARRLQTLLAKYKRSLNRERFVSTVISVTADGIEDVYDAQIPAVNAFDANGFYVHNCGEQPLLPYDACTLGSINVGKFVKERKIDWEELGQATRESVRFLDNVLDMNNYPIAEIAQVTRKIRRIGLGIMGFADLLAQLEIGYNTKQGLETAEKVMGFIQERAKNASVELAQTRGVFPAWEGSIYDPDSQFFKGEKLLVRNAAVTTIAPTGTIAMLADASSGIEPYFALSYAKNTIEGKRLFTTNPYFLQVAQSEGFYSDDLLEKIEHNHGSVQGLEEVPQKWQEVFVTAHDIAPEWHVKVQAAFQKHVDNAISKTINFPYQATVDDVRQAYMMVYETGCKGITIYRSGSRQKEVLEVKKDNSYYDQLAGKKTDALIPVNGLQEKSIDGGQPAMGWLTETAKAPEEAWGTRLKKKSDVGNVYTAVFRDRHQRPVEVFINVGKSGGYVAGAAEVTGRLASLALKHGATLEEVASELIGIACGVPYGVGPGAILSMFDAAGKSILEAANTKQLALEIESDVGGRQSVSPTNGKSTPAALLNIGGNEAVAASSLGVQAALYKTLFAACPDCGSQLLMVEGCQKCSNPGCGYSKC